MSEQRRHAVEHEGLWWPILLFFLCLSLFGVWSRVDCAIGVKAACDEVAADYKPDEPRSGGNP